MDPHQHGLSLTTGLGLHVCFVGKPSPRLLGTVSGASGIARDWMMANPKDELCRN